MSASDIVHLLVVRAAGLSWGLPMDAVENTFDPGTVSSCCSSPR